MEESLLQSENIKGQVWEESKKLWGISFPAIISRVTTFGVLVVTQAFIGHISEVDLAAYALTQTLTLRFANGILLGMSSATETLCGQAFGAKQFHMLGIYLQRSWLINFTTATILLPIFIFTEQIFKLVGEEDAIAKESGKISLWFIPTLYSYVFSYTIQQFLQTQLKNRIVGWLSAAEFLFHLLVSWLFVIKLNFGISGAMAALSLSSWILVFAEFVYIFGGWCSNSWKGFSTAAFTDLLPVLKLSISSGIMICLEVWYNSILVLVAGYMTNAVVAISAFSICLSISTWEFMISLGFLCGASVRVSIELGSGNAKGAKFSVTVILCTAAVIGVLFWILCLVFGSKIGSLFTSNEEIIQTVSSLSVLLAFTILLNSVQPVLSGMYVNNFSFIFLKIHYMLACARTQVYKKGGQVHCMKLPPVIWVAVGSARQGMVAYINIGSYYVIGVPIGVLLAYVADMEVKGLWIGMMCGVALQTAVLGFITWRTNWEGQVEKASERLNRWFLKPSDEPDQKD